MARTLSPKLLINLNVIFGSLTNFLVTDNCEIWGAMDDHYVNVLSSGVVWIEGYSGLFLHKKRIELLEENSSPLVL